MAASVGLEPTTITLTACSSTNWAMRQRNPPSQYRTDDFLFFKQALYQLSYRGKTEKVGFEPTTVFKPLFLSRKVPLATRPLLHSENGGIWTPECSVAQTELLSGYNSFSRLQLHMKYTGLTHGGQKPGFYLNISRRDAKFFSETGFFA